VTIPSKSRALQVARSDRDGHRRAVRPAKRLISYRLSLAVVIPLMIVVTGALIAGVSYTATRTNIRDLASSLFDQIATQTADRGRAHLQRAAPAADLLVRLVAEDPTLHAGDELARRLLLVMEANRSFSWMTFSEPTGAFVGVHRRSDNTLIVNRSSIVGGKTVMDEHVVGSDGTWRPLRHGDDTGYDPRTRPFYQQAAAEKRLVWTEPYIFFDEGVPGITCAEPIFTADGALRGVVTVDFDLNALGSFVASLHASEHTLVFIYTEGGVVLAHPHVQRVAQRGQRTEGKLVTFDDIADPVARAYFVEKAPSSFSYDGDRYLASTRAFDPAEGLHWRVGAIAPESDFMGQLERTTRIVLAISLAVVIAAVVLAMTIARRLARPLARLAREMDEVGRFELAGEDPPASRYSEIEQMNAALARMRKGLASFAVYVPRDLVRAVLASGQRAELGGKTKTLTVFFADIANFTPLAEKLTPAELVDFLAGYFDAMSTIIGAHRGTIDKFIGDAIMAFWNAPADEPDHAGLACAAALACHKKLVDMKRADPALAGLSVRIGIATGDAVVGNIGSHDRLNYTVMGDTVNLASRLEGLNKVHGTRILASAACRTAAGARLVMRAVDVVAVKGKSEGVRVYEPLATEADADDRVREIARLAEEAIEAYLARRWKDAALLYGEILKLLPGDRAAETMRARCVTFEESPPPDDWDGTHVMHEK
jgi:adenylate cyclase